MEPRERIRIDGQPLSEAMFAHYFWQVRVLVMADARVAHYRALQCWDLLTRTHASSRITPLYPAFFRFTNLMAFKVRHEVCFIYRVL